jgi:hypothetical protein
MSRQDFKVTNRDLDHIQVKAERLGHIEAVRQHFKLPPFPEKGLDERAHWHFTNGAASPMYPHTLERSWIKAIEDAFQGKIFFHFEIDQYLNGPPNLQKRPDNPS